MLRDWKASLIACLLLALSGCQAVRPTWVGTSRRSEVQTKQPVVVQQPTKQEILARVKSRNSAQPLAAAVVPTPPAEQTSQTTASHSELDSVPSSSSVQTVGLDENTLEAEPEMSASPIERTSALEGFQVAELESFPVPGATEEKPALLPLPEEVKETVGPVSVEISFEESPGYPLDLPTALALIGGQHPAVGFAQWRVQEAYAQLDRAEVLWLPSLQAGFSYNRHDGNLQASDGQIIDVNRNSLQYGLGAGAVGAGTTTRPGVVAQFHVADAIFQPEIAQKNAWAKGHAANATFNRQLLDAALAYIDLLAAEEDRRILEDSRDRTADLAKLTGDFAITGQGLQADADRLATELVLVKSRLAEATEQADIASARLAQTLSINAGQRIVPRDPHVVPIELVPTDYNRGSLISTGLSHRPELKEAQNLVAAACDEYKRQKYAPLIPSVLLGFSTGGFGGGNGNNAGQFDNRYDLDALMLWEVRNLGLGEKAARRETQSRVEQARFEKIRLLDQVAAEIAEAHAQVQHRRERIEITRQAIQSAEDSYQRNLNRIRDAQGLPIEVLQSVRALEESRRAYLKAVVEYNQAQFQLQWALGWQVVAPAGTAQAQ